MCFFFPLPLPFEGVVVAAVVASPRNRKSQMEQASTPGRNENWVFFFLEQKKRDRQTEREKDRKSSRREEGN